MDRTLNPKSHNPLICRALLYPLTQLGRLEKRSQLRLLLPPILVSERMERPEHGVALDRFLLRSAARHVPVSILDERTPLLEHPLSLAGSVPLALTLLALKPGVS